MFSPTACVFVVGTRLPKVRRSFSKLAAWADYLVYLDASLAQTIDEDSLSRLLIGAGIPFERTIKKSGKRKVCDLGPGIDQAQWLSDLPEDCVDFIELHPEDRLLSLRLGLHGDELVRPEEVLAVLFGGKVPEGVRIVRRRFAAAAEPPSGGRFDVRRSSSVTTFSRK